MKIGSLLRPFHAGARGLAWNHPALAGVPDGIVLGSASFQRGGAMPPACLDPALGGANLSPALCWSNVPDGAVELVLIAQDPDAPLPWPVVHMIVVGIPTGWTGLPQGAAASPAVPASAGRVSFGKAGYIGPKPPAGHGTHRYMFQIVATDRALGLRAPALKQLLAALEGRAIGRGRLIGTCTRG